MPEMTMTRARLDPRRPLVLDVRELGRRAGSMKRVQREVPAPADLGLELARVPDGAPVELDLRLEAVVEGVLVSGTATAPVRAECGRCLEPVRDEVTVDIQELFAYADSTADGSADDDEVGRLAGDLLDLEPAVRDAIVLALPLSPLCRDDCRGLCSGCGARWDDLPAEHTHDTLDPRWAALTERFGAGTTDSQENH
jgi:uncharacterized protein